MSAIVLASITNVKAVPGHIPFTRNSQLFHYLTEVPRYSINIFYIVPSIYQQFCKVDFSLEIRQRAEDK